MEDTQRIVKCGNLSLHTPGGFFKKRWHPKYLVLYDGSKSGIKRLELFDSEIKFKKQNPAKIIPLVDCVRVVTCQRQKTTYTFEVRTSDQFYLLAGQSFQDMTDWVNCLRLVAFGQSQQQQQQQQQSSGRTATSASSATPTVAPGDGNISNMTHGPSSQLVAAAASAALSKRQLTAANQNRPQQTFDVLLETRRMQQQQVSANCRGAAGTAAASDAVTSAEQVAGGGQQSQSAGVMTASQAAAAAASALAKTRQRQPSLLGSCKPQPPNDSPFIQRQQRLDSSTSSIGDGLGAGSALGAVLNSIGSMDTLTPTVRGQLISAAPPTIESKLATSVPSTQTPAIANQFKSSSAPTPSKPHIKQQQQPLKIQATLDEEEENMLYCSIEDNPSEHNYRVKVIETELSLRCQLKCYQLTAPTLISEQYEELNLFRLSSSNLNKLNNNQQRQPQIVTFYQLIIGPQELTLLNDYATAAAANCSPNKQQGLWSWPYQCIRRYGFDKDNCFMFEAGRKCSSGPGQFIVQTPKAYLIYQDVVKFVNELRTVSTATGAGEPVNQNTCTTMATTTTTTTTTNDNNNGANQAKQLVVTQIPVAWTPNEQQQNQQDTRLNNLEINQLPDSQESRKHFFNALRQLDPTSIANTDQNQDQQAADKAEPVRSAGSPVVAANNNQQHPSRVSPSSPSSSSSSSNSLSPTRRLDSPTVDAGAKAKSKSGDSKSETDESGYDQGDDSVDSGSRSFKQPSPTTSLIVASRKRQANDSMSSASSTSSGGSPGQSISRGGRANVRRPSAESTNNSNNNNGQGPAKRPPINGLSMRSETNKPSAPDDSKQQHLGLHHLITDEVLGSPGQTSNGFNMSPREFEANLMRDVYSEITKLHAKFAVTSSGSADDSMSSHSSQVETCELVNKSGEEEGEGEEGEGERDQFEDDFGDICEPTYSNVRLLPPNGDRRREARRMRRRKEDFEEDLDYEQQNGPCAQSLTSSRHEHYSQPQQLTSINVNNNYPDYLSSRPLYPTVLNPIPECGELATSQQQQASPPPVAPKPHRFLPSNNNLHHCQPQELNTTKSTGRSHGPQTTSDMPTLIERGLPSARLATSTRQTTNQKTTNSDSQPKLRGQQLQQPKQNHSVNTNVRSSTQARPPNKTTNKLRPTNHYVINDVQYAKISRNLHSNFESCL